MASCAADITADATCYICQEDATREGIVRGCACRGTNGLLHLSCLARMARAGLEGERCTEKFQRCVMCNKRYHGDVATALGWDAWKAYGTRPGGDPFRRFALQFLGLALIEASQEYNSKSYAQESLRVTQVALIEYERYCPNPAAMLVVKVNLSNCYNILDRLDEALAVQREVFDGYCQLKPPPSPDDPFIAAGNLSCTLNKMGLFAESESFLRNQIDVATSALGPNNQETLRLRHNLTSTARMNPAASRIQLIQACSDLQDIIERLRLNFGASHPSTQTAESSLLKTRKRLAKYAA